MECSTSIISALGKRARETLADERRKRKTIQVLNDTIARQLPLPVDSSAPTSSKRRPASSTSQKTIPVPNTSTINPEAPSGSRVVRLYIYADRKVEDISLVTPDVIYKFFLGLEEELEKIFVLLPYPLLVTPLDEDPTAMSMQKGCSWLRTFVQFTSSTVADLAVQRSGEAVSWRTSSSSSSSSSLEEEHPPPCVTIVVQPIHYDSTVLTQKMAIDAIRGEPLLTTVQRVQDCLPSLSNHLVFCMAASLLHLSHLNDNTDEERKKRIILQDRTTSTNIHSALQRVCDYVWTKPKTSTTTKDYLVRLYNSFWDCHAEVERTCSALFLLASGTKLENSILRIVESLQNWLLDEMEETYIQIMQHCCTSSFPASNNDSEIDLPSR